MPTKHGDVKITREDGKDLETPRVISPQLRYERTLPRKVIRYKIVTIPPRVLKMSEEEIQHRIDTMLIKVRR